LPKRHKPSAEELERMASYKWLTRRERHVFNSYYKDGLTIDVISRELDLHRRTVSRILTSIREKTAAQ